MKKIIEKIKEAQKLIPTGDKGNYTKAIQSIRILDEVIEQLKIKL